ncbi:MAG: HAMP domain-containing protein [Bacteroidales bacterium]|nr:HAMP domain-containing protein [Bacteroidales bacterium]
MKWKNFKIRHKFFIAFGTIIGALIFISLIALNGINNLLYNANITQEGNDLQNEINNKYKQHLLWAQDVNKLLTDNNITELSVQTDPTKCAFGKWYYGEERKHAEELIPELKTLLNEIEEHHNHLHESAIKIDDVFYQADQEVSNELRDIKSAHLNWMHTVKDALIDKKTKLEVEKDHTKCGLGIWLGSDHALKLKRENPEFNNIIAKIYEPHEKLHESAYKLEEFLSKKNFKAAHNSYRENTEKYALQTIAILEDVIESNDVYMNGMNEANRIYNTETVVHLDKVGGIFEQILETAKLKIASVNSEMISKSYLKRNSGVAISLVITIIAIMFAVVIAKGITNPIRKSMKLANEIATGNLTYHIEINQKDEIGVLSASLNQMAQKLREIVAGINLGTENISSASQQLSSSSEEMSQGASEQASSAEEVSSSMEEMASNIQQNTDNSQQTEKIAIEASNGIRKVAGAAQESMNSIQQIAEKISIVNDIAFQTNILALNAAVEAARAGEHGKGFAVVAAEVRKLAERSKIAADEINNLSKHSLQTTESAGVLVAEILPEIQKTAKLVQEISAASIEQNSGANQINGAIQQLSQVTQQNAAASEEMATSSEELSSQAEQLREIIAFFDTGEVEKSDVIKNNNLQQFKATIKSSKQKLENNTIHNKGFDINLRDSKNLDSEYEQF